MTDRLPTSLVTSALIRRVHDAGGFAAVRAKGDPHSGALLLIVLDPNTGGRLLERRLGPRGEPVMIDSTPKDASLEVIEDYWRKRRRSDPDLWVIELDVPGAERFAAETVGGG